MSWFRIDDGMLDHPKWKRAIRTGGDAALHLWLALGTWCSRHLTDGKVPADMLGEIPGPRGKRTQERAWRALTEASLIVRHIDGSVLVHDYLHYNPSRDDVLAERERWRGRKQKQRVPDIVPPGHSRDPRGRHDVPSRPLPVPGLSLYAGAAPELTDPGTHIRIPAAWVVTEELYSEATMAGVTRAGLDEAVKYWRGRKLGGEWFSIEDFFRGKLAAIRSREEKTRFVVHQGRNDRSPMAGSDLDTTGAATAFRVTDGHREYAHAKGLDVDMAAGEYRKSPECARRDSIEQERDFMNRLRCWFATGTFHPNGPLPKPPVKAKEARA